MSVKAVPELDVAISSSDDFLALEEKIYRTIELLKQAREGHAAAEREARRLREQISGRDDETESLRREVVSLRREREEVRARVEKMVKQIDSLTADDSAR
jgi:predicted  nucleic acid-binding Zn-ribbon protein